MSGRMNRDSRREDVRSRRKTLRQSALDAKRGTSDAARETPDEASAGRITRNALRTQTARAAAARRVEEKKMRKAITDREVQKAKPPFNPYVRVKHTGLSPFKSYQEARKRAKTAPWRAPPAQPAPSTSGTGTRPANNRAPAHGIAVVSKPTVQPAAPEMKMAAGVIQFPILPHMHHAQITFRAPAKVQPIPLTRRPTKSNLPVKREASKENIKPAPKVRPVRGVSVKAQSNQVPKVGAQTKIPTAAAVAVNSQTKPRSVAPAKVKDQVVKPARKTAAAPATKAAQPARNVRATRAKSAAPPKPGVARAPVPEAVKPVLLRRIEPPAKKARPPLAETHQFVPLANEANQDEEVLVVAQRIQPPARVLRSSSRLQHRDKENLIQDTQPLQELPLVQRRRTKKPTAVVPQDEPESEDALPAAPELSAQLEAPLPPASDPNAALQSADLPEPATASSSSGPSDERVKGLMDRSTKLTVETDRLRSLADEWVALKSSEDHLTQNAIDEIDAVTGQTYLLITKKFIQYKGLIEGAYNNLKTTLDDLDGFWEMVYIQVEQLDNQYRKLEDMKKRNWTSHSPTPVRKPAKAVSAKPPKRPPPKANFRKFLAAKKKEMATSSEPAAEEPSHAGPKPQLSPGLNMSVDEMITSPIRSAHSSLHNTNTPTRQTLGQAEPPAPVRSPLEATPVLADTTVQRQLRTPRRRTQRGADSPARKSARVARSSSRKSARVANSPLQRPMRVADSPLRGSVRATDSPFSGSVRGADSPFRDSPRAIENARRASRSIRLSAAMMRASQAIANDMDSSTIMDPLAT